MADWRQIQARIRKAKNAPDALGTLSELYSRTRDAMVAWELGTIEEKSGRNEEAVKWYTTAFERFRRGDWKKKAQDALGRLGAEAPSGSSAANSPLAAEQIHEAAEGEESPGREHEVLPLALGEVAEAAAGFPEHLDSPVTTECGIEPGGDSHKKRRRGRRGGRGRHRKGHAAPGLPTTAFAAPAGSEGHTAVQHGGSHQEGLRHSTHDRPAPSRVSAERRQAIDERPMPMLPSERTAHGRAGDPALASRMAKLESMLRRLVSSSLHRLDELDEAPAGPGVFLLSDSDQITSYYIESCQTLRVGLGNLVRGGRGAKGGRGGGRSESELKARLAEHLGINESKVAQYMRDHCAVRWIQLDEDAAHLAHFAIGVLRTPLNID